MLKTYSVIVPIYNEEGNIATLHKEIVDVMEKLGEPFEILFINDGSTDGTRDILSTLSPLRIIDFRKNFGQTAALDAGFKHAKGRFFITLDGDGQNPPSEIPKLIWAMTDQHVDVISGWRKDRKDSLGKRLTSLGANGLRKIFVQDTIHDSGCTLKIYRAECFENVSLFGEMHRFIPAILSWEGFSIGEIPVVHRPRLHGTSKYGWKRIAKGFIDMIAIWFWRKYASRPLHLFGAFGILLIAGGVALTGVLLVQKFYYLIPLSQSNLPLVAMVLVVLGVQFFISGILADILIRMYYRDGRTPYAIRSISEQSSETNAYPTSQL